MKSLRILSYLLIFLGLSGCIKEDMSECPLAYNTQLAFSYTGDTNDQTMFAQMIRHVNLYVFTEDTGKLVATVELDKNDLDNYQGAYLQLEPGKYKVVCWGNADSNSHVSTSNFINSRLSTAAYANNQNDTSSSHLYYGSYTLTVDALNKLATGVVPFKGSHINMEIYVKGLSKESTVQVTNLASEYDFSMQHTTSFTHTYYPHGVYDQNRKTVSSLFQTLLFGDDNNIEVKVFNELNVLKETVNLKNYMIENNLHVEGKHESTISMLIEFNDYGVSITIPNWESTPVEPEI